MTRPHIAIMLPRFSHYGGAESFAWRLSKALGRDCDVTFICARQETEPPNGVRVIQVGRPFFGKWFKILWFALAAEWIRQKGHYDLSIGLGNTICQDILRISGGPTRVFWKYSIRAYPQGLGRTWKMTRRRCSLANRLVLAIEKLQMRLSDRIITNSHLVRTWLLEAFPDLKDRTIPVIYNLPDLSQFAPCTYNGQKRARMKLHIPQGRKVIATASTNFMLKGIGPLIKTMQHLSSDTFLMIAGGRRHKKYNRLAKKLGVADRIRFLGRVDDMVTFYHASDLFVLLSFYDACSNAVLEALASGLPVISTTTNGSSSFLPQEHIVAPEITPDHLARKIECALKQGKSSSFSFPKQIQAGIEPFVAQIIAALITKTRAQG